MYLHFISFSENQSVTCYNLLCIVKSFWKFVWDAVVVFNDNALWKISTYQLVWMFCVISKRFDNWSSWWRHQMETFSALLAICAGNLPVNSLHKGQWRGALIFSLISARINVITSSGSYDHNNHLLWWLTFSLAQTQSPTQNLCHRLIIIHEMCVLHLYRATSNMDANRKFLIRFGLSIFQIVTLSFVR